MCIKSYRKGEGEMRSTESASKEQSSGYTLMKVNRGGSTEEVGSPATFSGGWAAGQSAVHEDRDNVYALYSGKRRVARFCAHRLATNDAAASLDVLALS